MNVLIIRAFRFANNNFDSIHARKSIGIDSSDSIRLYMAVTQDVGGKGGAAWLGAVYGVLPRKIWVFAFWVPHCPVPALMKRARVS